MSASPSPSLAPQEPANVLLVACLCARWCRTCDAYRATLAEVRDVLQAEFGPTTPRFAWVDVEDDAELVGDLDIEDFPTLLLARADALLFFGPLPPHAQTLERLVRGALADALPAPAATLPADARALPRRLLGHPPL